MSRQYDLDALYRMYGPPTPELEEAIRTQVMPVKRLVLLSFRTATGVLREIPIPFFILWDVHQLLVHFLKSPLALWRNVPNFAIFGAFVGAMTDANGGGKFVLDLETSDEFISALVAVGDYFYIDDNLAVDDTARLARFTYYLLRKHRISWNEAAAMAAYAL
jgi:hypothetical protein